MNAFTQAHKMTKEIIQAGDNYAATFALCLKHINQKAKTMKPELLEFINKGIADSEAYIARLEAFKATNPTGYIIVTGSGRIPVMFHDNSVTIGNIESANRYNDLRIATAKGRQVHNGNNEQGRPVYITEQVEWEIGQQQTLINQFKEMLNK